jgi:beta-1,4-mannosyl-glycoprotein beta-1,4-N-acetylglucosaminyltransferase
MLDYRLNVLNNVVDYFILVEARQTHVGKEKKLFFEENKQLFEKFSNKIIHIIVDLPFNESNINISNGDQWINEKFQRNCINQGLEKIKHTLNDNDHIIIADVDEIPDPKTLLQIKNKIINNDLNVLEQEFYYYNLNSKRKEYWYHCKTISYKKYRELNVSCDDIRFLNGTTIKNGGWHLSYFGDSTFIKNKLENFSHQEYNSDTYTNLDKISEKINNGLDLFNRDQNNMSNSIQKIPINDNLYLPPLYDTYLKDFYDNFKPKIFCFIHSCNINKQPLKVLNQTLKNITIGFHSNQLCERGTEIAMYDYAYYNQKLYGNKSVIFYCKHSLNNDSNAITKFEKEFKCYAYDDFSDIDKFILDEKIDYFYNIKGGEKSDNQLVTKCPNLIHAVFTVDPHGDKYATISKQLSLKYNNIVDYVPHMINLPECSKNMRIQLNIPDNAIVLGRIGGFYQFDIKIAHNAIKQIVDLDSNIFFLFVNTNKFYEHPQIIYLNKIIDPIEKVKFINTCDAMIHARSDGETFGLAIAEFSSLNKPVITSVSNMDNSHIEILGSKGIIYDTVDSLMEIFKNIRTIIKSKDDWNAYKEYTSEIVMKKFMNVFIQ